MGIGGKQRSGDVFNLEGDEMGCGGEAAQIATHCFSRGEVISPMFRV